MPCEPGLCGSVFSIPWYQETLGGFSKRFQPRQTVFITPKKYERFLSVITHGPT